jgi:hypothetical protein
VGFGGKKQNGIQLPDAAPPSRLKAGEVAEEGDGGRMTTTMTLMRLTMGTLGTLGAIVCRYNAFRRMLSSV